jgi:hypothetical protein
MRVGCSSYELWYPYFKSAVNNSPALKTYSCNLGGTEIIRSYSALPLSGPRQRSSSPESCSDKVMKLRNIVILFMVFLLSFTVARTLMAVSRAEELGTKTAQVGTSNALVTDVASAQKRSSDGEVDHIFLATSTHFESLLLLLLGSVLLAVASGIKMAQSRRLR